MGWDGIFAWGQGLVGKVSETGRDWRRYRLFGPTIAMVLGGLAALVLISVFLIARFDAEATKREMAMVESGFARHLQEIEAFVAPNVGWDDAIAALDHSRNLEWTDYNLGSYLFTFNGFTQTFVLDGDGTVFYASREGKRASLETFDRFNSVTRELLPMVREKEARRPAIKPSADSHNAYVPPIQSSSLVKIEGKIFIVTASLVQPDLGKILPKHPRAPVVLTAKPLDEGMLREFAGRYMLEDLRLVDRAGDSPYQTALVLRCPKGKPVTVLTWKPQQPGSHLLRRLALPFLAALLAMALFASSVVRRGAKVANDLIASEARAKHLAYHDSLTRLPNRAMLFERLRKQIAMLGSGEPELAVLCVDLDRFKDVNDTLGHQAGDLLIQSVASRLRTTCGDARMISRLGGDEFVVLCDNASLSSALDLAKAIIAAVSAPVATEYGNLEVGCSIGVAMIAHAGIEPSEALRWADLALYRSKDRGRACVTVFEPEMDAALRHRRSLEADLRTALTDGSLHMAYQPQVDIDGRVTGVEALVRWQHPVRGSVPPGVFVPLAEETGLILALGEQVLRRVFAETAGWQDLRVAINVSAVQMRSPGFASLVIRLAAAAGIDPSRYEIELTETALLSDEPAIAANIEALRRIGMSIALDDFGTGYSSLGVLQRFSVDKIKIDRSFVNCIEDGGESEALIDAMVKLARALDLHVIAEGVETADQRKRLAACGCRDFQGHLLGMPMSAGNVSRLFGVEEPIYRRVVSFG
jgi:diguanylate cyclase (GGDEF)-like protein